MINHPTPHLSAGAEAAPLSDRQVKLSPAQQAALEVLLNAKGDVLLLGGAGTGKSTILRALSEELDLAMTATTGIAAINVQGCTIDSLMGFSRDDWQVKNLDATFKRMMRVGPVIVIDEASMIGEKMAGIIQWVAREFKKRLILVGDFAQASAVKDEPPINSPLFLNAQAIHLTEYFRQNPGPFLEALGELRHGTLSGAAAELFRGRVRVVRDDEDIIRGYATNATAGAYNQRRLNLLKTPPHHLTCEHTDTRDLDLQEKFKLFPSIIEQRLDNCRLAHGLTVKVGARVLLTRNVYDPDPEDEDAPNLIRFVNGDTGTLEEVLGEGGKVAVTKVPDFSDAFSDAPKVPGVDSGEPVTLRVRIDRTGQLVDVQTVTQDIRDPQFPNAPVATVTGFPVMLGFACTISKLQGMTLHELVVDIKSILHHPIESRHGLVYVALSRVRTLEGLHLTSWDDDAIYCDPRLKHLL